MSALGTVTVFPSSRRYSTSACTMVVAPNSHTFLMWWVRPSIVEKKPVTASRTASRPVTGSALPKRKTTSGVRWVTNLSGLKASMSEKTLATSLAMTGLLREGLVMSSASAAGFEVAQECLRWWGAPEVWWNVPFPSDPAVVDLVDVGEPFDPRTPGIRVVVEEVRADGVAAQPPSCVSSPAAHAIGAKGDGVDGWHLEASVVEARVAAGDEPEDVVVAGSGVQECHQVMDAVADAQAEHCGVEVRHLLRLGCEQQGVAQSAWHDIRCGLLPLRDTDPLAVGPDIGEHLADGTGRCRRMVEKMHGGTVRGAQPEGVPRRAPPGVGDLFYP